MPRRVRSRVFGRNPTAYDRARLTYPDRVYEILRERCGLRSGAAVFEIGPGTGIASRELRRFGADPLLLIEPDRRLARYLRANLGTWSGRVGISVLPFERAPLPSAGFDLGVAATSFHWLPERRALRKIGRALKPGGWWATWNNHHGDGSRSSPFHRALQPLYRELAQGRPGGAPTRAAARKYRFARLRALRSVGSFTEVAVEEIRWTATLRTARVQALWGSFSEIVTLPPRKRAWFLNELGRIVDRRFAGEIDLPVLTPIYTARRIDPPPIPAEVRGPK